MKSTLFVFAAALACGQTEQAQLDKQLVEAKLKLEMELAATKVGAIAAQYGVVGGVVKGAPYSAESVTENSQTLGDGNRIRKKSTILIARDSDGRLVQQENTPEGARTMSILDPVASVTYVFNHKTQTAYQRPLARAATGGEGVVKLAMPKIDAQAVAIKAAGGEPQQRKSESLGKKTMEGLVVEGTRETTIIPANAVGNERPIEITFERWYSPELQTNVFTQRHDPRSGDSTFQLTNVRRGDPPRHLFEVPAGYTISQQNLGEIAADKLAAERAAKQ